MADKKISQLTQKPALESNDELIVVDNSADPIETKKVRVSDLDNRLLAFAMVLST